MKTLIRSVLVGLVMMVGLRCVRGCCAIPSGHKGGSVAHREPESGQAALSYGRSDSNSSFVSK